MLKLLLYCLSCRGRERVQMLIYVDGDVRVAPFEWKAFWLAVSNGFPVRLWARSGKTSFSAWR